MFTPSSSSSSSSSSSLFSTTAKMLSSEVDAEKMMENFFSTEQENEGNNEFQELETLDEDEDDEVQDKAAEWNIVYPRRI
jgi:hypothetical protein